MTKWRTVRVRHELVAAVESALKTSQYKSLSEFVSDAVQLHLDGLRQNRKGNLKRPIECPVIHDRLLFTQNHMWVMVTPEGNVRVGLSDFAQTRMDGIVSIQTDRIGSEVKKEKPFGTIETWLFRFDLYSPVDGKIMKLNETLRKEPFLINQDPYEKGWIAEISPSNLVTFEEELRDLMRPDQYGTWASKLQQSRVLGT